MKVFYDRTKFYGPLSLSRSFLLPDGRSTRGPGLGSGTTRSTPLGLRFVEFLSAQGKLYGLSQLLVIRSSLFSKTAGRAGYPSRCENGRYGLWFLIILEIKVRCLRIHCTGSQGFQTNKSMQAVRTDFFGVRVQLSQERQNVDAVRRMMRRKRTTTMTAKGYLNGKEYYPKLEKHKRGGNLLYQVREQKRYVSKIQTNIPFKG